MDGSPSCTGRQSGSEIGSKARAKTGSRTERRQTWACLRIHHSVKMEGDKEEAEVYEGTGQIKKTARRC